MIVSKKLIDSLNELINIGVGRAASILSEMLDKTIKLNVPSIEIIEQHQLSEDSNKYMQQKLATITLDFLGKISGQIGVGFQIENVGTLVSSLTGEDIDSPDIDSVTAGTLSEVGNIILNNVIGSMANVIKTHFDFTIPVYAEETIAELINLYGERISLMLIVAKTQFTIKDLEIIGNIILLTSIDDMKKLEKIINSI